MHPKIIPLLLSAVLGMLASCSPPCDAPAGGFLEISFSLNKAEGIEPSYQTVIWLEKENGEYLKPLLVSEYLAYGGYENPLICPDWILVADWENVPETFFDAVTRATPPVEENTLQVDCKKEELLPGLYHYCIQTHIIEGYNILYRGEIEIGGRARESKAEPAYTPEPHPAAGDVLKDVKAKYYQ